MQPRTEADDRRERRIAPPQLYARSTPALRLTLLYALAVASVVGAWLVVLTDPYYRDRLRAILASGHPSVGATEADPSKHEVRDPALGTPLPATALGRRVRRETTRAAHGYLVATLGDCASCTSLSVACLHRQARPRKIGLVAIASGDIVRVRQYAAYLRSEGLDVPLYHDADGKLLRELNAYYAGRLYYYMPDWRLRWRERDMRIDNYLFATGRFDRIKENSGP